MATSVACYLTPGLTWQIWQVGLHCCTRTHEYSEQQQNVALEISRLMCYPCKCSRRKLQRQLPHKQIVIRGCRKLADNSQATKSHLCNSPSGLQSEWACTQTDSLCRVTKEQHNSLGGRQSESSRRDAGTGPPVCTPQHLCMVLAQAQLKQVSHVSQEVYPGLLALECVEARVPCPKLCMLPQLRGCVTCCLPCLERLVVKHTYRGTLSERGRAKGFRKFQSPIAK